MKNIFTFLVLIIFIISKSANAQQVIDPANYITVDNFPNSPNSTNDADSSTSVSDDYNEVRGWYTSTNSTGFSWSNGHRQKSRLGNGENIGAQATWNVTIPPEKTGNYLIYSYVLQSPNNARDIYYILKSDSPVTTKDSIRHDLRRSTWDTTKGTGIGVWVPLMVDSLTAGKWFLTLGADLATGKEILRADAVRFLKSSRTNADLEFGRRTKDSFERVGEHWFESLTGTTTFKKIHLYNLGGADLIISNISIKNDPSRWKVQLPENVSFPFVIHPGEKQIIDVGLFPMDEGDYSDELIISSNDSLESVINFPLSGNSIHYNFILNASLTNEPHYNVPFDQPDDPRRPEVILNGNWLSSGAASFPYPIIGNFNSLVSTTGDIATTSVEYKFQIPESATGYYTIEWGIVGGSVNGPSDAQVDIKPSGSTDTIHSSFSQQSATIPSPSQAFRSIHNTPILLKSGDFTTVKLYQKVMTGFLRSDLLRVRKRNLLVLETLPDSLRSTTNHPIKWDGNYIEKIKIEYSTNNGSTWTLIATDINGSQGNYNWQVAAVAPSSSQCKIRISDVANPSFIIESKLFTIYAKVFDPTFSVAAGTYHTSQNVMMTTSTDQAEIRYTLDGTEPTQSSLLYSQTLNIDSSQSLKARAFKSDWISSAIVSATYTFAVANPIISLNTGTYNNAQICSIMVSTEQAEIRYTHDGSEPTLFSSLYSLPMKIDTSQTLKIKAFRTGWVSSAIISRTYNLLAATPIFSPAANSYSTPQTVSISSASDSVKIYYTLDNSEPNESSTVYSSQILIDTNKTLKAKAFKNGWTASDTKIGNYTISGQVFTINFNTPNIWLDANFDGKESKTITPVLSISYGSIVGYEWKIGNNTIGTSENVIAELPTGTWHVVLLLKSDRGTVKRDSIKISVYAAEATTTGSVESAVSQLSDNIFFVTSKGGSIYRFDSTGVIAWTILTGGSIQSTTCVSSQDNIYVGSSDTRLYSFDYQGTPRWDKAMGGTIVSSPSSGTDGLIYVGISTGRLFALDEAGNIKWNVQTGGPIYSSPSIDENGVAYFGSDDYKLYAVSPAGTVLWTYNAVAPIRTSPALGADSSIVFGSMDGFVSKVGRDGIVKWNKFTGGSIKSSPVIGLDGIIYIGSNDGKLYSFAKDGQKLWEYNAGFPVITTPSLGVDGTIYFGSLNGTIFALDQNGNEKWNLQTGKPILAPMLVTNSQMLMVGDTLGKVYIMKIPSDSSLVHFNNEFVVNTKNVSTSSYEWWTFKGNNQRTGYRKDITTGVKNSASQIPEKFALLQNYPNPFNPSTIISYQLPVNSFVTLKVFDVLGKEVAELVNGEKEPGSYSIQLSGNSHQLASGVYFYTLKAGNFVATKKLLLMK